MEVTRRRFSTPAGAGPVLSAAAVVVAALAAAPLVGILLAAASGEGAGVRAEDAAGYALSSGLLAAGVGLLIAPLGALSAWLVVRYDFPLRSFFSWALALPLALPVFASAYAYADMLDPAGPLRMWSRAELGIDLPVEVRSLPGAAVVFSLAFYPYVFLSMKAAFSGMNASMLEAASSLGATPAGAFLRVVCPLAWPALAAGVALGVMETLADYGAVYFLSVQTLTTAVVRSWSVMGSVAAAAQYALPLLGAAALFLWVERSARGRRRFSSQGAWRPLGRRRLSGPAGLAAGLGCGLLLFVSLLAPAGWLLLQAIKVDPDIARLARAAGVSLCLALAGSALTVACALVLSLGARGRTFSLRLASLGYAAPGAVIALGLLAPVSLIWRMGAAEAGVLLSLMLLVGAYASRLMAAALEPIDAAREAVGPMLAEASRSLGRGEIETARAVEIPLMSGALLAAGLIVFVDVLKELPATLMLRPFNFDTLAVIASNYALDERLAQAGWPSLAILCLSAPAVAWLARRGAPEPDAGGGR